MYFSSLQNQLLGQTLFIQLVQKVICKDIPSVNHRPLSSMQKAGNIHKALLSLQSLPGLPAHLSNKTSRFLSKEIDMLNGDFGLFMQVLQLLLQIQQYLDKAKERELFDTQVSLAPSLPPKCVAYNPFERAASPERLASPEEKQKEVAHWLCSLGLSQVSRQIIQTPSHLQLLFQDGYPSLLILVSSWPRCCRSSLDAKYQ